MLQYSLWDGVNLTKQLFNRRSEVGINQYL